jgi:hypothetical protein
MQKLLALLARFQLALMTLVTVTACDNINLRPAPEVEAIASTKSEVTTEDPKKIGLYSYVMFVIDKSGSNVQGNGGAPSDPNRESGIRATAIRSFFERNKNNPYIRWGFIAFQEGGGGVRSYIPEQGAPNEIFTDDPNLMEAAIARFKSDADSGGTPYKGAIQLTESALKAELKKANSISGNFNIIFMTDGVPTDYSDCFGCEPNDAAIYADVESLVGLAENRIFMSTIYYGPENATAERRLETMAEKGRGKYWDTNSQGTDIDIGALLSGGESAEPYVIKHFGVYNLNAGMCDDGTVGGDSDIDGICDKDEERYNRELVQDTTWKNRMGGKLFDPTNRNSFSSKVHDGIYYRHIVYGEAMPIDCESNEDMNDNDFDLLSNCEEKYIYNEDPTGPTENWTKKMLENGKFGFRDYFDSDGDGWIDGLELLFFKFKSASLNFHNLKQEENGLTYDHLISNHMNPRKPGSEKSYDIKFNRVSANGRGQNIYEYTQQELPLYYTKPVGLFQVGGNLNLVHGQDENIILIYYIQVPENAPHDRGYLRYSYQILKKDTGRVQDLNVDTRSFQIWPEPPPAP